MMSSYHNLKAWREAEQLCVNTYEVIRSLPQDERFALGEQLRRSCISVLSNIAEGSRMSDKSFANYLKIAHGSAAEVEAQLVIINRLGLAPSEKVSIALEKVDHVSRLVFLLRRAVARQAAKPPSA